jgi:hypothetical protein
MKRTERLGAGDRDDYLGPDSALLPFFFLRELLLPNYSNLRAIFWVIRRLRVYFNYLASAFVVAFFPRLHRL